MSPDTVKALIADLEANPFVLEESLPGATGGTRVDALTCQDVINRLRKIEARESVRFVALPVEALLRLRACWEGYTDEALTSRATELLRDLFDGQDGHLHRIDAVLGRT